MILQQRQTRAVVKVKICGLTRRVDVQDAIAAGADMLGFVFAKSPRQLTPAQAQELIPDAAGGPVRVGLFMNQDRETVRATLAQVQLDLLQFHGQETEAYCRSFGVPYVKAIAMGGSSALPDDAGAYTSAAGLLFDGHAPGASGGSGDTFNWKLLSGIDQERIWLAGGLHASNVGAAVRIVQPWLVDVSSGVELRPGIKDCRKMHEFVAAARSVQLQESEE